MARPRNLTPTPRCWKRDRKDRSKWIAFVDVRDRDGRVVRKTLGRWRSKEAASNYEAVLLQLRANNGQLSSAMSSATTVTDICIEAVERAKSEYIGPDGRPTTTFDFLKRSLKRLRSMFGTLLAQNFGVREMVMFRESLCAEKLSRKSILAMMGDVRKSFRWAAELGIIQPEQLAAVCTVKGVPRNDPRVQSNGRGDTVSDEVVDATLPFLRPVVRDLVTVIRYSGARPDEICRLRLVDIDRADSKCWLFRPSYHKLSHRGLPRVIPLGEKCIAILSNYIDREPTRYVFSPQETVALLRYERNQQRTTPLTCGNRVGSKRKENPRRTPKDRYTTSALTKAIKKACVPAKQPIWSAYALRHAWATKQVQHFSESDVASAMGHADTRIIRQHYIHTVESRIVKLAQ